MGCTMRLVDSHTHLYLDEFADDRDEVMKRAQDAGLTHLFMPNIDSTTIEPMLRLCDAYPSFAFPMMGLHPTSVSQNYREELGIVRRHLDGLGRYVAVGEIGIDLYWDTTYQREQEEAFAMQVEWALELGLPIVIHCRKAFRQVYDILKPYRDTPLSGVFHSFTGEPDDIPYIIEFARFKVGINGVVTFKKSTLPALLPSIPLNRIVLETDSPYLTPAPNRGKRNESANILYTAARVAQAYGLPVEEIAERTSANALQLFGLAKPPGLA